MAGKSPPPKRANRAVQLADMVGKALDPALRKRGFASRDLVAHWSVIAPSPYDRIAMPDRLVWPRRGAQTEGATLYLRCREGHALALQHEAEAIAGAVNRYFGYFLIATIRLSPEPLVSAPPSAPPAERPLSPEESNRLARALAPVEDEALRAALARLGEGLLRRR